MPHPAITPTASGLLIRLKVVPGASRTKIAGILGDRLKLAVAAAPEAGKANAAVVQLLAKTFNIPARQITIVAGHSQPQKTVEVTGITLESATAALS